LVVVGLVLGPVLTVLLLFSFLGYGFCSDQSGDDARSCESDVRVQIVLLIVLIVGCLVAVIAGASMRSKRTDSGAPSDTSVPPPDQRPW
jgi:amino acid transporter